MSATNGLKAGDIKWILGYGTKFSIILLAETTEVSCSYKLEWPKDSFDKSQFQQLNLVEKNIDETWDTIPQIQSVFILI